MMANESNVFPKIVNYCQYISYQDYFPANNFNAEHFLI